MSKPLTAHQKHLAHLHQLHLKHLQHMQQGHGAQHTKKQVPKKAAPKKATAAKHAVSKAKGRTVKRALALGDNDIGCCVAEAVSASLRLSGFPVTEENVLDLFWQAGGDPDAGISIPGMLMTASGSELISCQLTEFESLDLDAISLRTSHTILGLALPSPHAVLATPGGWWSWGMLFSPADFPEAVIEEAWAVSWR